MAPNGKSLVAEWYNGKSIFVTGGSGFMGKVLVEKLLYSCPGVQNVFILMRSKKGREPRERIEDMWNKLPMFERLRSSQPGAFKKMVPVIGDLYTEGLGLSKSDLELITKNASIVFHCAATLKLEATLKDAIEQNTAGTARVIDIAKQIKKLEVFVHFSTAFCSADIEVFEERVYECKDNPRDVIDVCRWINPEALEKATPALIAPHPNTYTYSKRLAEKLVADEIGNMPVCIVRPSIVTPAALEPLPGWVDSLNGPMGLIVGAGKGVIRSMYAKKENVAQVVPVDAAINGAIVIARKTAIEKAKEVPVYNMTCTEVISMTIGEIIDTGRSIMYENPFEMQIWYPDGDVRSTKLQHLIYCIFLHWLPAYFIDMLLFIFRQKTFMVRLARKINDGLELLEFFAVRNWIFRSKNYLGLLDEMSADDQKIFPMDFRLVSVDKYLTTAVLGARQYLMKENLSTLPRCRFTQKIMFVIHKLLVYSFYFFIIWTVMSWTSQTKYVRDVAGGYLKHIPVICYFIPST